MYHEWLLSLFTFLHFTLEPRRSMCSLLQCAGLKKKVSHAGLDEGAPFSIERVSPPPPPRPEERECCLCLLAPPCLSPSPSHLLTRSNGIIPRGGGGVAICIIHARSVGRRSDGRGIGGGGLSSIFLLPFPPLPMPYIRSLSYLSRAAAEAQ